MPIIRTSDRNRNEAISEGLESYAIVDAAHGSDALRVGELTIAPMTRVPRHAHTNTEEAMVLLEGTLEAQVGSQRMTIEAGDLVLAPAGSVHGFLNRTDPARPAAVRVPEARPRPRLVHPARRATVRIPVGTGPIGLQVTPRPAPRERVLKA